MRDFLLKATIKKPLFVTTRFPNRANEVPSSGRISLPLENDVIHKVNYVTRNFRAVERRRGPHKSKIDYFRRP
jgi:hypothetical protein